MRHNILPGLKADFSSQGIKEGEMGNILSGRKHRWGKGLIASVTVILAVISLGLAGPVFSADTQVVNGIVNQVSGRHILLDGKKYDVAGVPVTMKNPGKRMKKAGIEQGDMIELSIQGGKIVSIRDFGPMLQ